MSARADEPAAPAAPVKPAGPEVIAEPKPPTMPTEPPKPVPPTEPTEPKPPPMPVAPVLAPSEKPQFAPFELGGFAGHAHATYRVLGWAQPQLQLGRRDTNDPIDLLHKSTFAEHRLTVGFEARRDRLELRFEADILNGLLHAGSNGYVLAPNEQPAGGVAQPDLADPQRNRDWGVNFSSFALREAALRYRTDVGQITFGVTTFNFGQGLASNSGASALDSELGDQRWGERVLRLAFSTKPLLLAIGNDAPDLTVAIGADLVLQDQTAKLFRPLDQWSDRGATQDVANGFILGLQHKTDTHSLGAFITQRTIRKPDSPDVLSGATVPFSTDLKLWAFDLSGDVKHDLSESLQLYGAFEGVFALGDTNYVSNDTCAGVGDAGRCNLKQGGAIVRGGVRNAMFTFDLLGGIASGDANPFDDSIENFKFDRDFKVGLIMFDQVLAWQSAQMVKRASDPLLTNVPNRGVELLSTDGAVTNALFVQPTFKLRIKPGERTSLEFVGSFLWARAPSALIDVYWTTKTGALTNSFGQPANRNYGVELDAGINLRHTLAPGLTLFAGVAGGLFLPGNAFVIDGTGATMDSVTQLKGRLAVQF
ncbi:MAG: hypothetical protein JST92_07555 [Deltaproteobacteria bacterium]|nr:hypothetical protein [Deltaproteobacteria bacterium]